MSQTPYINITKIRPIVSQPKYGWASFNLPKFRGKLSYIDNVADTILNACKTYLETEQQVVMTFDEEGSEFHVLIQPYTTFVIHETDRPRLYAYDIDAERLIRQLAIDIESNLEDWIIFNIGTSPYEPEYQDEYDAAKESIISNLNYIKPKVGL